MKRRAHLRANSNTFVLHFHSTFGPCLYQTCFPQLSQTCAPPASLANKVVVILQRPLCAQRLESPSMGIVIGTWFSSNLGRFLIVTFSPLLVQFLPPTIHFMLLCCYIDKIVLVLMFLNKNRILWQVPGLYNIFKLKIS